MVDPPRSVYSARFDGAALKMTLTRRHTYVSEYRLYRRFVSEVPEEENVLFYVKKHPHGEMGQAITFAKKKLALIIDAARTICLHELAEREQALPYARKDRPIDAVSETYLHLIPREVWIFRLLKYLRAADVSSLSRASRITQQICYDNHLWKQLCHQEWHCPNFLQAAFNPDVINCVRVPSFFKEVAQTTKLQFQSLLQRHQWRLTFVALKKLSHTPSVCVNSGLFNTKTWECFGSTRVIQYESALGRFEIRCIRDVGRVEYAVFNYHLKPWHSKGYEGFHQHPIFCLKDVGLLKIRCRRGSGYMCRKGYTLQTDLGQKLYFSHRFIPTARYRLFRQETRIFLLCQDVYLCNGLKGDCYTMYEIVPIYPKETIVRASSNPSLKLSDTMGEGYQPSSFGETY